jgi:hypothetical protein
MMAKNPNFINAKVPKVIKVFFIQKEPQTLPKPFHARVSKTFPFQSTNFYHSKGLNYTNPLSLKNKYF